MDFVSYCCRDLVIVSRGHQLEKYLTKKAFDRVPQISVMDSQWIVNVVQASMTMLGVGYE